MKIYLVRQGFYHNVDFGYFHTLDRALDVIYEGVDGKRKKFKPDEFGNIVLECPHVGWFSAREIEVQ